MGMFDSLYDSGGKEWQTKAYDRLLSTYRVGDKMPGPPYTYQVEILGGTRSPYIGSHATVHDGVLASIDDQRDKSLPLLDYHGDYWHAPEGE